MPSLKEILLNYFSSHQALPAFNIDSFEIFQAVEIAVRKTSLPVIVQLSPGEDKFITAEKLYLLVKKSNLEGLPIYLNLDHGANPDRLVKMSQLGYDMVHFDGSKLDYSQNKIISQDLCQKIHPNHLLEVEFDSIGSTEFTSPLKAVEFISETQADLLAVSIGNRHGNDPSIPESIDLSVLSSIHENLPQTFLTLHGGSGVPEDQIKKAISLGVVKININTDLRQAFINTLKLEISQNPTEKIYNLFTPAIDAVVKVVTEKLILFSSKTYV
jgi:fructose-bisphosphate aldolase class II